MNILEAHNYETMSQIAADIMYEHVKKNPKTLLCLATGQSPFSAYQHFIQKIEADSLSVKELGVVKLDEWCGLPKSDPATCECYLQENFLDPLQISPSQYISFDPLCTDFQEECRRIRELVQKRGGIDLCILGLGENGHLGLNEPGPFLKAEAHVADLATSTAGHAMLKDCRTKISQGYTLGMKDILSAKKILLLVTGSKKTRNPYFKQFLQTAEISTLYPAGFLHLHEDTVCIIDRKSL